MTTAPLVTNEAQVAGREPYSLRAFLLYFFRLGALGFGGPIALAGYMQRDLVEARGWIEKRDAIVPFLHGGVVDGHHWLTEQQFLDAVAVAMITPGPVVITVAFIGYLVAGPLGAVLASIGVFAPCFFIVVLAAPHYRRFAGKGRVKAFVEGVTAGAVGAIAGAVIVLARRSLVDPIAIGIALVSLLVLLRVKKLPEPLLILSAALVGIAVKTFHQ